MTSDSLALPSRRAFIAAGTAALALTGGAAAQPKPQPQIFACGGGFQVQAYEKPVLQKHLLSLSPAKSPKVCFLGAAVGEAPAALEAFNRQMQLHDCRLYHFNIFYPSTLDFADYLQGMDIIYVNGGATRNLLALWREWGFDGAMRTAWESGVVMSGTSAGMICWFQSGLTDSYPPELRPLKAMGILKGSANPHYNQRHDRPSKFRQFIASGELDSPGLALDQNTAAHYVGTELKEILTDTKTAGAYRLTRTAFGVDEKALPVRFLGSRR